MTLKPDPKPDEHLQGMLERYLLGECNLTERVRVERWLNEDPSHRAYLESLRTIGVAWAQARPRFDSSEAWQRMAERMETASPSVPVATRRPVVWGAFQDASRRATRPRWVAAGVVAATVVLSVALFAPRHRPADAAPLSTYITAAGRRQALTLSDGSKVRLAPGSRLVVEQGYGGVSRTVRLVGQAYFEVTHDAARPFRVLAGNVVAWDLGTKFTVRAYAGEPLRLAVAEGSVAIPQALPAPLVPGDVATVDSAGRGAVEHGADIGPYLGWLDGTLEFRETPLAEAAADLSRWYGVDVLVNDPALARRRITVTISDSTVETALDLIAPAVGARYERRGRSLILSAVETP